MSAPSFSSSRARGEISLAWRWRPMLASRSGGKIRYDWVGMVLCFVLVTAALVFFGIAWCLVYHPEAVIHY